MCPSGVRKKKMGIGRRRGVGYTFLSLDGPFSPLAAAAAQICLGMRLRSLRACSTNPPFPPILFFAWTCQTAIKQGALCIEVLKPKEWLSYAERRAAGHRGRLLVGLGGRAKGARGRNDTTHLILSLSSFSSPPLISKRGKEKGWEEESTTRQSDCSSAERGAGEGGRRKGKRAVADLNYVRDFFSLSPHTWVFLFACRNVFVSLSLSLSVRAQISVRIAGVWTQGKKPFVTVPGFDLAEEVGGGEGETFASLRRVL